MVAEEHQVKLERIKKNIASSYNYMRDNYERFNTFRTFVFKTGLTPDDEDTLAFTGKPTLEFNFLEAYISKLLGEFEKQEPNVSVHNDEIHNVSSQMVEVVEGHCRYILRDSAKKSFLYRIYQDLLSGGFSCMKIWTDYENYMEFDQDIFLDRVYDPTLCGFDPMARRPDKSDGRYFFENFPKKLIEAKEMYPKHDFEEIKNTKDIGGYQWSYKSENGEDIILFSTYFEKKFKKAKLVRLANNQKMLKKDYEEYLRQWHEAGLMEQPSVIVEERWTQIPSFERVIVCGNAILETEDTDFSDFPYVWVDGNSIDIQNSTAHELLTRPYVYHAHGYQRLKNFSGQTLGAHFENLVMHKFMVSKEAIPEDYIDAYKNVQKQSVLVYNQFYNKNSDIRLDPPTPISMMPAPTELLQTFMNCDKMAQYSLGISDSALGINENELSGKAIIEGAAQSNAAAMPYLVGIMAALNQALQVMVNLFPKIYLSKRNIPVMGKDGIEKTQLINHENGIKKFNYPQFALKIKVEAGLSTSIQQNRAMQQIIAFSQALPDFAGLIQNFGLPVIMDNMEFRGIDQLKDKVPDYMKLKQQQQQQAMQMNPVLANAKAKMAETQTKMQIAKLQAQDDEEKNAIAHGNMVNDTIRTVMDAHIAHSDMAVQMAKNQTEKELHGLEMLKDHHHKNIEHVHRAAEIASNILDKSKHVEP